MQAIPPTRSHARGSPQFAIDNPTGLWNPSNLQIASLAHDALEAGLVRRRPLAFKHARASQHLGTGAYRQDVLCIWSLLLYEVLENLGGCLRPCSMA